MVERSVVEQLSFKVEAAKTAIKEAQAFADEHGLEFTLDPAYGMGGTYYGRGTEDWDSSDCSENLEYVKRETGQWVSSTQSCQ